MAYSIEEIKIKIKSCPTKKPVFNAGLDSSGDLVFRMVDQKLDFPFSNPDEIEQMIMSSLRTRTMQNDDGTYRIENDVDSTFPSIMSSVVEELKNKLTRAVKSQDPKRTKIYKWFRGYSPRTIDEQKLMLMIYDYTLNNRECTVQGTKHAQNFVGLITHIWGKYGGGK